MDTPLDDFVDQFFQDIQSHAIATSTYAEAAFTELLGDRLIDAGEIGAFESATWVSAQRDARIDGFGGDPLDHDDVLTLIFTDYHPYPERATLGATELQRKFKQAEKFLKHALNEEFRNRLDESTEVFGLTDLIATRWNSLDKVRLLLISNRVLSTKIDGRKVGQLREKPITFGVWDLQRIHRFDESKHGRDDIEIDLVEEFGCGLPALPAHLDVEAYEAYLAVMPGTMLASIYDRWGSRLLEQNVRVFLQATGKVNRGIRTTIESAPQMFFAYNNGITATAEAVTTSPTSNGIAITRLKNLQIVNGGQTTASIHAGSKRKDIDLSTVFIQMKLSIIKADNVLDVVQNISQFANSQNRVSAADFYSNHPFHIRMEEFSRRLLAPSKDGSFLQTKWFYERARGQYRNQLSALTPSAKKQFREQFPRPQLFSKTDLAKFENVWRQLPHVVSQGAQKNFSEWATWMATEWRKDEHQFNEDYFRHLAARAIVFRETERIVSKRPYGGGYRANVVAYAIARMARETAHRGLHVNFRQIWAKQSVSSAMIEALTLCADEANDVITQPQAGKRNVTEWAKQQACWAQMSKRSVNFPDAWLAELVSADEQHSDKRHAVKQQKELNGIQAEIAVHAAGGPFWQQVLDWGMERRMLSLKEMGCIKAAAGLTGRMPSDKQCIVVMTALRQLQQEGCQLQLPVQQSASTSS